MALWQKFVSILIVSGGNINKNRKGLYLQIFFTLELLIYLKIYLFESNLLANQHA